MRCHDKGKSKAADLVRRVSQKMRGGYGVRHTVTGAMSLPNAELSPTHSERLLCVSGWLAQRC
jgi:hypothetical protein